MGAHAGQDLAEMGRAAAGVEQAAKAHAAITSRRGVGAEDRHPRRGAGAERIAAEIVVGEAEMLDQLEPVAGEDVGRIGGLVVRRRAVAVRAQVRHDHPEAARGDLGGMAEADPVHVGVGEKAVEQHHRPPLPHFVPGQPGAVGGGEAV